jgi:CHAD domain-containing protein
MRFASTEFCKNALGTLTWLAEEAAMPYRLLQDEPVGQGLRRVAREQITRAIDEVLDEQLDRHAAVHQVRKRCKKIRAVLRLCRTQCEKTYQAENAVFRDAARRLSGFREAKAMVETVDELLRSCNKEADRAPLETLRERLAREREEIAEEGTSLGERLAEFKVTMEEALARVDSWHIGGRGFDTVEGGLRKTYRRGRRALGDAYPHPNAEALHEWRKRVKYHWYHTRLMRDIWRRAMNARRNALDDLADLLGTHHDLATLRQWLRDKSPRLPQNGHLATLRALIGRRQAALETMARTSGERLFAEKPKHLVRRLRRYWEVWLPGHSRALATAGTRDDC